MTKAIYLVHGTEVTPHRLAGLMEDQTGFITAIFKLKDGTLSRINLYRRMEEAKKILRSSAGVFVWEEGDYTPLSKLDLEGTYVEKENILEAAGMCHLVYTSVYTEDDILMLVIPDYAKVMRLTTERRIENVKTRAEWRK